MSSTANVLSKPERFSRRGITFEDFPAGMRLSARIKDLRDAGHPIQTRMVEKRNRDGRKVRYANYKVVAKRDA